MSEGKNMTNVQKYEASEPVQIADPMVSMIERVVMDPNASIEKLEKMLEMRERLDAQAARKAFDNAISEAKAEIPPILKNRTVDFTSQKGRTNYRHEDLAEIARTVDPILSRFGLSYRFRTAQNGNKVIVTCVLSHREGHAEETSLESDADNSGNKNSIQAVGSAITFLQRYTLKVALGLSATTDDDGQKVDAGKTITADQYLHLRDMLEEAGADEVKFLAYLKLDRLDDLPLAKLSDAEALLSKKIAAKGAA